MMKGLQVDIAALSDPGRVRETNQDSIGVDASAGAAILADGVGGRAHGARASAMAVDFCLPMLSEVAFLAEALAERDLDKVCAFMRQGVRECNDKILAAAEREPELAGMASTLVMGLFGHDRLFHCHLGDSRIYCLRLGQLSQLTQDHSLYQEHYEATGVFDETIPGNAITRALGVAVSCQPDCAIWPLRQGDVYLFCSDGITKDLGAAEMGDLLAQTSQSVEQIAQALVDQCNANGGNDNISVVVARVR
ncbi:MAG: serine/threonine-protein phosphatase [Gammaproteobacteria bacterium]|nr:serine/threonine-protein phosphatase [Gammaproteobacteria bacterium]